MTEAIMASKAKVRLLHVIGNDPTLRWFLGNLSAIEKGGATLEFKQRAEDWLINELRSHNNLKIKDNGVPGTPGRKAVIASIHHIQEMMRMFQSYGLIEETSTLEEYQSLIQVPVEEVEADP
jgi:hypothetical protein